MLHEQYGPVVRTGPYELNTISPTAWDDIYTSRPLLPKDPYSQTPPLNGAHSLFTAAGSTHKRIRGTLINGFSDSALRDQAPLIEKHASRFVKRIQRESKKSVDGIVDIGKVFGYVTFDVITDLSFGDSFDGLAGDNQHSWISGFFFHAKFGTILNCLSRFPPLDKAFGTLVFGSTRKNREKNWSICTEKIAKRLSKGDLTGIRADFLSPVIGKISENGQKGITAKEVTTNMLAVVIANCQLTTIALSTATYFLLRNHEARSRLMEEIRTKFKSFDQLTVQSTRGALYLDAVIKEALRIHHPTPITLPRVVPPEGRLIDGAFIPGNVSSTLPDISFDRRIESEI